MDYTAIGDTTNLASRMETMAKPGTVLVSSDTYKMARDFFRFAPLGKMRVKGKEEPVEAYVLVEAGEVETRIEAAVAKGLTKFVGRKREIGALKEAFGKARSGSGQVVGIVGEAGVGKSRIILELRGALRKKEYTYLEGRCLHYGGSMAYLPFLAILRSYFFIKEGEREFVIKKNMKENVTQVDEKLEGILPPLHEILSLKVEDEEYLKLEPQQKREKTFEAIRDLLIRESEHKPLILVVEDLHWIDKTSEEFLDYLIGWLANSHILLILLYRPEYIHQWGSKSYYSQIGVDQLSTETSAELVQAILEEGEVVPELRELILNRAAGNPLFMEEFTHTLVENGSIQKKDHQYVLSIKASDIQVPDTIQGIIAARMDRLEDNLKRTMQVASVIGRDFAFRILQTITGMREELKSYLINLQGLEFIYEKSLFPELEYIFKHALTQEVAYNSLLLKRRKEIHEKIGKAIEELYADRLEEFYEILAHHYLKSANSEKAYQYLKLSGDKATRNYSNWEAFRFYREAINVLNKLPETEENNKLGIELRLLIAYPMTILGFPENSLDILQEGERLSKEFCDSRSLAKFYGWIGFYHSIKGQPDLGMEYSESCFREAEKVKDIDLMASTAISLCGAYHFRGEHYTEMINVSSIVIALLEETRKQYESFGTVNPYSMMHSYYSIAMDMMGDFKSGKKSYEKGLDFALEIKDLNALSLLELDEGLCLVIHKGDGENGIKLLQNAIRYCEEGQMLIILGMAWMGLGWGHYLLGKLETALDHVEKGLKIHSEAGLSYFLMSLYYCALSMIHCDSGDLKMAQSDAEEALRLSQDNHEKWPEGLSRVLLGRTIGKGRKSQYAKAEEYILQGTNIFNEVQLKPLASQGYLYLGELHADNGQKEKALENLKKAEGMMQEMGMGYWLRRTQEVLERLER